MNPYKRLLNNPQSASFLGYVGVLTVVKPPFFTLTINERFNKEGGFIGVWRWIMGDRLVREYSRISSTIFC